jgi:phenylacetate-CoA ligase
VHSSSLVEKRFANEGLDFQGSIDAEVPSPLEAEVRSIYRQSPFYGRRLPLHAEPLQWGCFEEIPFLTKKEIVESGHEAFFEDSEGIEQKVSQNVLESETTSGSTGKPMTVIMETGWWEEQTARAYRAHPLLAEFADRSHRKAILAPVNCSSNLCPYEDFPFPNRYFDGAVYLNLSSDPFCYTEAEWERITKELIAVKPEVIEGEPGYLSLLARAILKREITIPSLKAVILTYGKASKVHARSIQRAFQVPLVDLYGSTEAGYLFVGDAFADNMKAIDENAFIELIPHEGKVEKVFQIVVTTRNREAMPLLRYHTGDLVLRLESGYRLLGREKDLFVGSQGSWLSSVEIDEAFPEAFPCWHYCLTQISEDRWNLDYVADEAAPEDLGAKVAAILGGQARVNVFRKRLIQPLPSGKFALFKPKAL